MNQCRNEKSEPSVMHFRCQLEGGHSEPCKYFVPEDGDLVRKDRDSLVLQNEGLRILLQQAKDKLSELGHWGSKPWHQEVDAAIQGNSLKLAEPSPLVIDTRCPKCKQSVDNVIHFCPAQ